MGTFQGVVQERGEQFGVVGSRTGSGHRPARHYHAALPVAQIDDVTYTFDAATVYTTSVDGIATVVDGADVADLAALVDAKIAAVNAHPQMSQIVAATLLSAGIMRLRARTPGTAFTTLATEVGGGGAGTPATTVANVVGAAIDAGAPMFGAAAGTNPRLVALPSAATDVFRGLAQFRHRAGDLQNTPAGSSFQPGEQLPVDPDGPHILIPEVNVEPTDPLFVRFQNGTVGAFGNAQSGAVIQSDSLTFTGVNDALYTVVFEMTDGRTFLVEFTADASATDTEVRDGIQARMILLGVPVTPVDLSTDALTLTSDVAGVGYTMTIGPNIVEAVILANSVGDMIQIAGGAWLTSTISGNKGEATYDVA